MPELDVVGDASSQLHVADSARPGHVAAVAGITSSVSGAASRVAEAMPSDVATGLSAAVRWSSRSILVGVKVSIKASALGGEHADMPRGAARPAISMAPRASGQAQAGRRRLGQQLCQ